MIIEKLKYIKKKKIIYFINLIINNIRGEKKNKKEN